MISYPSHNNHTPGAPNRNSFWHHISNHQRIQNRNHSLLPQSHKDCHLNSRKNWDRKSSSSCSGYNLNFLLKGMNRQSWHYNNEWQIVKDSVYAIDMNKFTLQLANSFMTCFIVCTISGINAIYNLNITDGIFRIRKSDFIK